MSNNVSTLVVPMWETAATVLIEMFISLLVLVCPLVMHSVAEKVAL